MKALLVVLLLAGCASSGVQPVGPAQKTYQMYGGYAAALTLAIQYKNLPPCPSATLCADPRTLQELQDADNAAYQELSLVQSLVRKQAPQATIDAAMSTADIAVRRFTAETSALKVK